MKKPSHKKMTSQAPMYVYATEMVSSYYSRVDIKNKRILSIVGSGDQVINAYFFGAKEVVGFDINKNSFFMLDIKFSAILNLDYKEFINFFGSNMDNGTFKFDVYKKIESSLSLETKKFFNKLYKEFKYDGKKLLRSEYFRQRSMIKASASSVNIYLKDKENYIECREIIKDKELKFLELDINDIAICKNLKGKFDVINLSNVLNYLTGNTAEEDLLDVLSRITKSVSKRLRLGGLFFYYSYTPSLYGFIENRTPPASRIKMIKNIAKENNFRIVSKKFKGVDENTFDSVNIVTM